MGGRDTRGKQKHMIGQNRRVKGEERRKEERTGEPEETPSGERRPHRDIGGETGRNREHHLQCERKQIKKKEREDTARIQRKVLSVESLSACQKRAASLRGCVAGLCPLQ